MVPQSPMPFLKPGYVKTKRQDKLKPKAFLVFSLVLRRTALVIPMRYVSIRRKSCSLSQRHMGTSTTFRPCFRRECAFCAHYRGGGSWIKVAMEWWKRMWIWEDRNSPPTSQESLLASNRVSLQAWLLRLLRLFHAGGPHRRAGEVPPRLLR